MAPITQITNAATHTSFKDNAETRGKPTVIYVSNSSLPACRTFTPQYEDLAARSRDVDFAQIDFSSETSMLFKFAPNQLPVLTLMCRESESGSGNLWAKTIMGANLKELERGIAEMLHRAGA